MIKIFHKLYKLLILACLLSIFFIFNISKLNKTTLDIISTELIESEFIDDEIKPYCDNINYSNSSVTNLENLEKLNINLVNKSSWYTNLFDAIKKDGVFIFEENKKRFRAEMVAVFKNGYSCKFNAQIRISGDFQDHLRTTDLATSLDVKLENGNIDNITNFKLFLPETKRGDTEFVVTSIMEKLHFLTPRTFLVQTSVNNQNEIQYIFQEKITKEFLEYNSLRESVLLETNEEFLWEKRKILLSDNVPMFAKILNENWVNISGDNQKIALEGLSQYNQLIMQSDGPYLNYNLIENNYIHLFDTAMYALDGHHGLVMHNRKFYYNKFLNKLIPIYYDSDSQISSRETSFTYCSENLESEYEKLPCVNNFALGARILISQIDFDSDDLFSHVYKKNKSVDKDLVEAIYNRFLNNLFEIAELGNLKSNFEKDYFLNFKNKFEKEKDNQNLGFYIVNLKNSKFSFCNFTLSNCQIEDYENIEIKNRVEIDNKSYYLLSTLNEDSNSSNHQIEEFELTKDVWIRTFNSPPKINISPKNRTIFIEMIRDSKILFFGDGELKNWSISILGAKDNTVATFRQDSNLLTGCITFLNLKLEDISVYTKENKCEDAINFINVSGSIQNLNVENSYFDSVDIDFSNLLIQKVNVTNSGNDCLDISFTELTLSNFVSQECSDKAISIGEKSKVNIEKAESVASKILVAVKDSSLVSIDVLNGMDAEMCVAMYRKKQEFGPSKLNIKSYNCIANNQNFIQIGQEVKIES